MHLGNHFFAWWRMRLIWGFLRIRHHYSVPTAPSFPSFSKMLNSYTVARFYLEVSMYVKINRLSINVYCRRQHFMPHSPIILGWVVNFIFYYYFSNLFRSLVESDKPLAVPRQSTEAAATCPFYGPILHWIRSYPYQYLGMHEQHTSNNSS